MINTRVALTYYTLLFGLLIIQTVYTIYQSSRLLGQGQTMQALLVQKKELQAQRQALRQILSQETALATIKQQAEQSGYQPITKPLLPVPPP